MEPQGGVGTGDGSERAPSSYTSVVMSVSVGLAPGPRAEAAKQLEQSLERRYVTVPVHGHVGSPETAEPLLSLRTFLITCSLLELA